MNGFYSHAVHSLMHNGAGVYRAQSTYCNTIVPLYSQMCAINISG